MTAHATPLAEPVADFTDGNVGGALPNTQAIVEATRAPVYGPLAARWREHAEFCRKQAVLWASYAGAERDPSRRDLYERDARRNWDTAAFALRQATLADEHEAENVAA